MSDGTDKKLDRVLDILGGHTKQLDLIATKVVEHDRRFDEHDKRFDEHDRKFDLIFQKFEEHDRRFIFLEQEMLEIRKENRQILDSLDAHTTILQKLFDERDATNSWLSRLDEDVRRIKEKMGMS